MSEGDGEQTVTEGNLAGGFATHPIHTDSKEVMNLHTFGQFEAHQEQLPIFDVDSKAEPHHLDNHPITQLHPVLHHHIQLSRAKPSDLRLLLL